MFVFEQIFKLSWTNSAVCSFAHARTRWNKLEQLGPSDLTTLEAHITFALQVNYTFLYYHHAEFLQTVFLSV